MVTKLETYKTLCARLGLPDLREVNLNKADLTGAYLHRADLTGAGLREVNLTEAYLRGADLRGADLRGACLRGADLRGAHLARAYLRGVNLSKADLTKVDLTEADLTGADLAAALGYVDLGVDHRGYHFRAVAFPAGWQITAGCRNFTVEEAVQHWKKAKNQDALARVAILKAHPLPSFA